MKNYTHKMPYLSKDCSPLLKWLKKNAKSKGRFFVIEKILCKKGTMQGTQFSVIDRDKKSYIGVIKFLY